VEGVGPKSSATTSWRADEVSAEQNGPKLPIPSAHVFGRMLVRLAIIQSERVASCSGQLWTIEQLK
jgi:hypothetical protein